MKVCVISPGVVHAVPRTVAIRPYFETIHFIDVAGTANSCELTNLGIHYYDKTHTKDNHFGFRSTVELLGNIEPDVIICHFTSGSHFFTSIAYGQCPVVAIAMGQDVLYDKGDKRVSRLRRLLVRMGLRSSLLISAKSKVLMSRIESYGVASPIMLNYWGANLKRFAPADKLDARKQLRIPENCRIILSPRAIEPRLNIDEIVSALAIIRSKHPDILLLVIGRSDKTYQQKVMANVAELGLKDNIRFDGEIEQELLPTYYNAADLIVSMARSEGFPNTILEVMGCKAPMLIGDIEQVRELLGDRIHCRLCDITNESIARTASEMLDRPKELDTLVENSFNLVKEVADIDINGKNFSEAVKAQLPLARHRSLFKRLTFSAIYFLYRLLSKLGIST